MVIIIQRHPITTRCERCLPAVLEQHHDCFHLLSEIDNGQVDTTLIIKSDTEEKAYTLTPEQVELMKTEGPEAILAEIEAWENQQSGA